jgi:cytochrome P450
MKTLKLVRLAMFDSSAPQTPGITKKGEVYRLVSPLLGNGILTAEGAEHTKVRKVAEMAFGLDALELTCSTAHHLMQTRYNPHIDASFDPTIGGARVKVYDHMLKLTLDTLGEGTSVTNNIK